MNKRPSIHENAGKGLRNLVTSVAVVGSFLALAAPAMANMPIDGYKNYNPSFCGLFGGAALSLLLTASGCWAALANRRGRR